MASIKREGRKAFNAGLRAGVAIRRLKKKGVDIGNLRKAHDGYMNEVIRMLSDIGKDE